MAKCGNPKCVKERKDKEALAKACAFVVKNPHLSDGQVLEKCWKALKQAEG